jgi:hypothetical protein
LTAPKVGAPEALPCNKVVVVPKLESEVGAAPAPPPSVSAFAVKAPEELIAEVLEKYGTPPDVPDVIPIPPWPNVTAALVVKTVAEAFGKVKVFVLVVGPVNAVKPLAVPPLALAKVPVIVELPSATVKPVPVAPPVKVPVLVKDEPTTVLLRDVPVRVPAAAVTVILPVPSKVVPLIVRPVCSAVAVPALPVVF